MTKKKSVFDSKFKAQAEIQTMRRCDEIVQSLSRPREPLTDVVDEIWYRKWETLLDHQIAKFTCLFDLIWELHERLKALEEK